MLLVRSILGLWLIASLFPQFAAGADGSRTLSESEFLSVYNFLMSDDAIARYKANQAHSFALSAPTGMQLPLELSEVLDGGLAAASACGMRLDQTGVVDRDVALMPRGEWTTSDLTQFLGKIVPEYVLQDVVATFYAGMQKRSIVTIDENSFTTGQRRTFVLLNLDQTSSPETRNSQFLFAAFRALFGWLPVAEQSSDSHVFSYFIGGTTLAEMTGAPSDLRFHLCTAAGPVWTACNGDLSNRPAMTRESVRAGLDNFMRICNEVHP